MSTRFSTAERAWHAWVEPVGPETGSAEQIAAYEESVWPKSPYFRLLAWHPEGLRTRTALDQEIFLSPDGLPRGEREFAATVTSRWNGCELCASVHARFATTLTKRSAEVRRLLEQGVDTDFDDARWQAIAAASAALTASPPRYDIHHVRALRAAGLSEEEIQDVVEASAFFAWANRMMLSLGEPAAPARADAEAIADQRAADSRAAG